MISCWSMLKLKMFVSVCWVLYVWSTKLHSHMTRWLGTTVIWRAMFWHWACYLWDKSVVRAAWCLKPYSFVNSSSHVSRNFVVTTRPRRGDYRLPSLPSETLSKFRAFSSVGHRSSNTIIFSHLSRWWAVGVLLYLHWGSDASYTAFFALLHCSHNNCILEDRLEHARRSSTQNEQPGERKHQNRKVGAAPTNRQRSAGSKELSI